MKEAVEAYNGALLSLEEKSLEIVSSSLFSITAVSFSVDNFFFPSNSVASQQPYNKELPHIVVCIEKVKGIHFISSSKNLN